VLILYLLARRLPYKDEAIRAGRIAGLFATFIGIQTTSNKNTASD